MGRSLREQRHAAGTYNRNTRPLMACFSVAWMRYETASYPTDSRLNLSEYVTGGQANEGPILYDLYAVSVGVVVVVAEMESGRGVRRGEGSSQTPSDADAPRSVRATTEPFWRPWWWTLHRVRQELRR